MSNMSYCRFRNTVGDLKDCVEALLDDGLDGIDDEEERAAAKRLIKLCREVAENFEDEKP